jgi:hypothetical protein
MIDTLTAWAIAAWTALTLFVATNIEPMPGVWVAAISGALLSAYAGEDRKIGRLVFHIFTAVLFGVFSSQIITVVLPSTFPFARVAEAYFCAMFSERIIAGIHNGTFFEGVGKFVGAIIGARGK